MDVFVLHIALRFDDRAILRLASFSTANFIRTSILQSVFLERDLQEMLLPLKAAEILFTFEYLALVRRV